MKNSNITNIELLKKKQKDLILKIKKELIKYNQNFYQPNLDIPAYFAANLSGPGLFFLKKKIGFNENIFKNFFFLLKDFFYSSFYSEIKILNNKQKIKKKKVIFTWAFKKNFKNNGSLDDKYFNINSNEFKNIQWIVLYLDKKVPKKINDNIFLIQTIKTKKIKIYLLLKIFISNLKYLFINYRYFLFCISNHNFLSNKILELITGKIEKSVKFFLFPYEAQPFQHRVIKYLDSRNIKSIGYIHAPPLALPYTFIKKKYSPSKIFVSGVDQKRCFIKLGWKKKEIILIPSTRFLKKRIDFSNQIFLPVSIKFYDQVIKNLEYLIINLKLNINQFKIRNHPDVFNSTLHNRLTNKINFFKKKYNDPIYNNSQYKNFSIFIGASGAIIEALERGCKVIQITEIPVIDFYSNYLWKSIKIKKINDYIFSYSILKKGNLINFGNKPKNLNIFFDS